MGKMTGYALVAVVSAIFLTLLAIPASAQATRTWVSGTGDDANPCSRTAPCKTFAGAIAKTAPAGEIDCLDPGGFGALTITKAITILCMPTGNGGVLVSGTNGITVAAGASDHVVLEGLDFEGLNSGLTGVNIISGLEVDIINCRIRNFKQNGVGMTDSVAGSVTLIQNSLIIHNGTTGTANTGGVNVQGPSGVSNAVELNNTVLQGNANYSAQASGSSSTLLASNTFFGSALSIVSGGGFVSFGPSNVIPPGSPGPTTTIPFK